MGTKLLTRLRVELSDLRYHKFRHNFNCSNPSCLCLTGIDDNEHSLLHCRRFATQRRDLLDLVSSLSNVEIVRLSSKESSNLLLYGHPNFTLVTNRAIVESTVKFNKSAARRLKTDWTIATLSFSLPNFRFLFFFYCIITFIMHCIFLKNCIIIVFVNAGDAETRYNLSFFYCSKHKKWNVQTLFQLIRKNVYGKPLSHLFDNPT